MSTLVSVRLDDATKRILEAEAEHRGLGLSAFIRESATEAAKEARRARIREQTKALAEYIARSPEAQEFFEFWGAPRLDL